MPHAVPAPPSRLTRAGHARHPTPVDGADHAGRKGARAGPIRVMIADGQVLVRAGLRALFDGETDVAVVAEAADGAQALALAEEIHPDVALIDICLPGLDALELTRRMSQVAETERPRVLILAAQTEDEHVFAALRAGASGFLLKEIDGAELVQAMRVVAAGGAQLSPCITRRLVAEIASQPDPKRPSPEQLEDLTAREREVVTLVAAGLSNQEIAERLVVSPATAKTHVSRALFKLDARDRAQLVALAYETGFVLPGHSGTLRSGPPVPRAALVAA